jgi:hypothetical protein
MRGLASPPVHLMPFAVLKDDLIKSFHDQMRGRDDELASVTAELNACYARLVESDSILERCDVCCCQSVSDHDPPWQRLFVVTRKR